MKRLNRLDAAMEWLGVEGYLLVAKDRLKVQELRERFARLPAEKQREFVTYYPEVEAFGFHAPRPQLVAAPSPAPSAKPHPEETRAPDDLGANAARRDAPQDEAVRAPAPATPPKRPKRPKRPRPRAAEWPFVERPPPFREGPPLPPYDGNIFQPAQLGAVGWRQRGPEDDDDRDNDDVVDGTHGQCIVDYDPLARQDKD